MSIYLYIEIMLIAVAEDCYCGNDEQFISLFSTLQAQMGVLK